ncbi:hypothetical protein AB0J52_10380 [Spirillospora sp. NPDC049652]
MNKMITPVNNTLIPLYVTLQTFVQGRVEKLQERERGASALEYGALILVGAAVIAVLWAAFNANVKDQVSNAVKNMFTDGGAKKAS